MIKTAKRTKKFILAISTLVAILVLATTIFASGVLANAINNNSGIEVLYGAKKTSLWHNPFIDNEEIYLPFREVLNHCGIGNENITYDNGKISFAMYSPSVQTEVNATINVGESGIAFDIDKDNFHVNNYTDGKRTTTHPVILKNGVTYAPLGVFIRIKDFGLDHRNGNEEDYVDDFRYSRATKYNLLQELEVRKYREDGSYDVVLSPPINVKGENKLIPETYYGENERVFIGTAGEQEEYGYHYKEVNYYYYPTDPIKRILVDNNGNVLAIVPAQNQKHETLNRVDGDTLHGHPEWRIIEGEFWDVNGRYGKNYKTCELICDSNAPNPGRLVLCFFIPTDLMVAPY